MGVSPGGGWVVYQESDEYSQELPTRQPPVQVMAISSDGRERRDLYGVYDAVNVADSVLGWLSESTLLIQRADSECGMAAPGSSLTLVEAPVRPFREACSGRAYTRLEMGDRVMVSLEPPAASRLRSGPGLTEPLVDSLEPGEEAEIIGGPACDPTHVWWMLQPSRGGPSGWAAEGDAEGAWLLPIERGP